MRLAHGLRIWLGFDAPATTDVACLYLRRGSVSNRGIEGPIYEILDEQLDSVMTFGLEEFKGLWAAQAPAPPTKV